MNEKVLQNSSMLLPECNSTGSSTECENLQHSLKAYNTTLQDKRSVKVFKENAFIRMRDNGLHIYGHTGMLLNNVLF